VVLVLLAGLAGVACSIGVSRDLSAVPPGQVGFDDLCGLQEYFDKLEMKASPPPRVVSSIDLEGNSGGKQVRGGRERFAFEGEFQLTNLRRVLEQNWKRLPEPIAKASLIEVEVKWSEKAGTKRVLTSESAELAVGQETWELPYHPCLSELLYGEALYRQRRTTLGLPPLMPAGVLPADGGVPPTPRPDGSVDGSVDARSSDLK
jgi:hypothetical protein